MADEAGTTAPILVGVLYDFPQADGGALFEDAVRVGLDEVAATGRLDRPVELVARHARGLPAGTAHDVERAFAELVDTGVLAVLGPSISDNGLIVGPLADARGVPCINYTGGERTRGEFMYHYQVGSLEEEPAVLARHLVRAGHGSVAVAHDHSPVGRRYAEFFAEACGALGIDITGVAAVSPLAQDVSPTVRRLRAGGPEVLTYLGLGVAARAVALGVVSDGWDVPVVANSALMFGYARRDWRAGWEGWVYVDSVSDDNAARAALRERSPRSAAGPIGVAAYDMGRLIGEAVARAAHLTRQGIKDGLERVKQLPASSGMDGTTMGFGHYDHAALKGRYLVLRRWSDGRTVQVEEQ
ncbi:MAG TPA: ABC transporter substrate-binding protein [Acidimicrobiales bacterium]|nr:ABC transporter substrate-binding protein [Acidimicrobiales bacterium]